MDAMPLLQATGSADARASKSIRAHAFDVPDGTEGLALAFDFTPKRCTSRGDNERAVEAAIERHAAGRPSVAERLRSRLLSRKVPNLLNVVLVDPHGRWRGRWDRVSAEALVLGNHAAADGFLPGPIPAGRWIAAVEIHSVLGDPVAYEISVEAARAPSVRPDVQPATPPSTPLIRERWGPARDRWRVGELHSHSLHSDGAHSVADLLFRARGLGLDFLALTDHNATSGLFDVRDPPVTLIRGSELTTFAGHHPIYGIDEPLPWHEDGRVIDFRSMFDGIRRAGAIVSAAHPFRIGDPICTGCRMDPMVDPAAIDMFEVWYKRWDDPEYDSEAGLSTWERFWRDGHSVTGVAARDWHGPAQETPFPGDDPFTAVRSDSSETPAILDALRRGLTVMTGGPLIELAIEAGGRLSVETFAAEPGSELRIVRSGAIVERISVDADARIVRSIGDGFYRADLWRDGLPRALTNHVREPSP
jgi:hypothetical protein